MAHRSSVGFALVVAGLVLASGGGLAWQWRHSMALRTARDLLRFETGELARLRAANQRLREAQPSAAELQSLRADHAALPRLRAEMEGLKKTP